MHNAEYRGISMEWGAPSSWLLVEEEGAVGGAAAMYRTSPKAQSSQLKAQSAKLTAQSSQPLRPKLHVWETDPSKKRGKANGVRARSGRRSN